VDEHLSSMLHLWSTLRAAHHLYWTLHWQAKGPSFQGDHTLFGGLYQERAEEIDKLAELIAAHYGSAQLDPLRAWAAAQACIEELVGVGSPVAIAEKVLAAVEDCNEASLDGAYPAGTTNLVSDIGTKNLMALYKLKQRYKI
jgi:DNA-binding ferritin-like protein